MLPVSRIQVRINGNTATPVWLGADDYVWLRALISDFVRLNGRRYRDALTFLQEPSRIFAPPGKRQMAVWMLQNMCSFPKPSFDAAELREAVSIEAQRARDRNCFNRNEVIAAVMARYGISADTSYDTLFSDLPMERRLLAPDPVPEPSALAAETNLALAQGLLNAASSVRIELYGGARAVVRQVHLRRLLCVAERAGMEGARLHISGTLSLFHHTTLYGHALASILPLLAWCDRFDLTARCVIQRREAHVRLCSNDPLARRKPPRQYDSRLEERFARDFARASTDWDLVREPEPFDAGGALIFPDFAVVNRRDVSKSFLLEIVGFWTPAYLREKLQRLRDLPDIPMILCIDRSLNCGDGALPPHARIVWFQKKINPTDVLSIINSELRIGSA